MHGGYTEGHREVPRCMEGYTAVARCVEGVQGGTKQFLGAWRDAEQLLSVQRVCGGCRGIT